MSRRMRLVEWVYRMFLRAFPRSFRRRMGTDMVEAFRDGCNAARSRSGRRGVLAHVLRATAELLHQGMRERTTSRLHPHPRSPRRGTMLDRVAGDFRHSLRALRRAPAFTLVAALTLAAGIGATTAIFSVVHGVLLQPLPFRDPDRLVSFTTRFKDRGGVTLSEPEFLDLLSLAESFDGVGAVDSEVWTPGGAETPERIRVNELSAEVLAILDVEPAIGRPFAATDDTPDSDRVVLLSNGLWQQRFAADPGVVGAHIELEGIEHTVIGVMPEGFDYPNPATRAWVPLRLNRHDPWERNNHYLRVVGRLREGVSLDAARAELDVLGARLTERYPEFYDEGTFAFELAGMLDDLVGASRAPLMMLFAAVSFVLLVACTNVANLLLARSELRRREIAVRSALGGGRGAIVTRLLTESVLPACWAVRWGWRWRRGVHVLCWR